MQAPYPVDVVIHHPLVSDLGRNDYEQLRSVIDDHDQLVTVVTGAVNALLRFGGEFYVMEKEATANTAATSGQYLAHATSSQHSKSLGMKAYRHSEWQQN